MNAHLEAARSNFSLLLSDPEKRTMFRDDPVGALTEANIPTVTAWSDALSDGEGAAKAEQLYVEDYWWGFDIVMNEKLTQDIIDGTLSTAAVAAIIGPALAFAGIVTGPVGNLIATATAAAFALKVSEMRIVDDGNGVHWPITWIQWAAVLAAVPTGPSGILAAILIFIHPVRN